MAEFDVEWMDSGREPQCPPNPKYPEGIDIDISNGSGVSCLVELPYPARRCGLYRLHCRTCGFTAGVTTAGRPDDPRSVRIACQIRQVA